MMQKMTNYKMTIVDLPMNLVYGVCLFGFACATARRFRSRSSIGGRDSRCSSVPSTRSRRRSSDGRAWTLLLGSFLAMMLTGVPVAIAMAGSALVYIALTGDMPPLVVVHRMISGIDSFPLLAVPFFILAGNLMNNAGITNRIYDFALALVGWMKGGLGHVNIIGSVIFAGMSGTAIADAAGLGTIEIKAMRDKGYDLGILGGRDRCVGDARPDHSAVAAVRHLRDDGQRFRRPAVSRRDPAGPGDGGADDVTVA